MTFYDGILQVKYTFQQLVGAAWVEVLTPFELPEVLNGEATAAQQFRLVREQDYNRSAPVVVESAVMLGGTTLQRLTTGDTESGFEICDESMLEISLDGTTWVPVGAGPSVDIASWFTLEAIPPVVPGPPDAVPSPQTVTFYLRLNVPAGASTTGDFRAWLEVFITE